MKHKKVSFLLCLAMLFGMLCQAEAKEPKYKLIWKEDFKRFMKIRPGQAYVRVHTQHTYSAHT